MSDRQEGLGQGNASARNAGERCRGRLKIRKSDHRRESGAASRAEPNMTGVLVAPILGPYRRDQLSIALNATHHVNLLTNIRR